MRYENKKNIFIRFFFGVSLYLLSAGTPSLHAQSTAKVGVNTRTPQAALHVKSTSTTSTDKNLQLENASGTSIVTVLNNGNTGMGTTTPGTTLEINKPTVGAIKITDTTQGKGKVLMSDANGVGTWQALFTGTPVIGSFHWTPGTSIGNTNWNKIASVIIPPGTHLVFIKVHFYGSLNGMYPTPHRSTNTAWLRSYVGKKDIGNNNANPSETPLQGSTSFSPFFSDDFEINHSFIHANNTSANQTIYLNLQSDEPLIKRSDWTYATGVPVVQLKGVDWFENYFYVVPIN